MARPITLIYNPWGMFNADADPQDKVYKVSEHYAHVLLDGNDRRTLPDKVYDRIEAIARRYDNVLDRKKPMKSLTFQYVRHMFSQYGYRIIRG